MPKKSAAQIRRLQKRAERRGEVYTGPTLDDAGEVKDEDTEKSSRSSDGDAATAHEEKTRRLKAAKKLSEALSSLESNDGMNSKERRSAKRKAEAIATEESGCDAEALLRWYKEHGGGEEEKAEISSSGADGSRRLKAAEKLIEALEHLETDEKMNSKERRSAKRKAEAIAAEESGCDAETLLNWYKENGKDFQAKKKAKESTPLCVFVGQLSYRTTKEGLLRHFRKELGEDVTLKVRLLTDTKTQKSRGMAFVETTDPETMYKCLQLHHTFLDGRCINVERSAGGKKDSESRKGKLSQYRKEQEEYMSSTIEKIIIDFQSRGDISEGELDEGVVALLKRHSAGVVEAALAEYVQERGESLENPSAYLTSIVCRIAAGKKRETKGTRGQSNRSDRKGGQTKMGEGQHGYGEERTAKNSLQSAYLSELGKAGVDMSISDAGGGPRSSSMSKIFPSWTRGRGRGRGGISP